MARIETFKRGQVGEIRLNRPNVLNAMGRDWPADMQAAASEMNDDAAIRVVLMTGAGRAFCSGMDLTDLSLGKIPLQWFYETELAYRALETMDKPVLAGLQGYCIGGGLQIAIACDARIATDDALLGLPATQEAFLPGMAPWRLPRVIGLGHAQHLILSGELTDGTEALRIGLVNRVVPADGLQDALENMAAEYLEVAAPSLKWAKRLTNQAFDLSFDQFLEQMLKAMEQVLNSEEHLAARQAWLSRKSKK